MFIDSKEKILCEVCFNLFDTLLTANAQIIPVYLEKIIQLLESTAGKKALIENNFNYELNIDYIKLNE